MQPRQRIYDLYWYFAAERQAMFERRAAGQPSPWTSDPILSHYKFCNTFRASDRVSQYLIREVIYAGDTADARDRLFRIIAFRFFSRIKTWDAVRAHLGRQPLITDLVDGRFERAITAARASTGKLYTGAFILCANRAYGFADKHLNHLALWREMFVVDDLGSKLLAAGSLASIFDLLKTYPLIGNFMAYQLAIDLNYSDLINFSENDFTSAGPGALRGITKAFTTIGTQSPESVIMWMVDHQEAEFARLGLTFDGLWGRALHAIDAQGLFCELDKYCREAAPELPSNRRRIKTNFSATPQPLKLFYPPKWGIISP